MHVHDVAATRRPFALNPYELLPDVEHQVVTRVLYERLQDANAQANRSCRNLRLGDVAFLVRAPPRCHEHMFAPRHVPRGTQMKTKSARDCQELRTGAAS